MDEQQVQQEVSQVTEPAPAAPQLPSQGSLPKPAPVAAEGSPSGKVRAALVVVALLVVAVVVWLIYR